MATEYKELCGEHAVIEFYHDGDVIVYRFYGQGIAEQVGTSYMTEADLFDALLAPAGLRVDGDKIVNAWGGARPGAGRKSLADEPTVEGTISLPQSLDAKAKRLGGGNRSAGIRKALESFTE